MSPSNNLQDIQDLAQREIIFARDHEHEDTARLLLSAARYPDIDMPLAVQQIEGRRTALAKWPSLYACHDYLYPPRLNREQASSEATARHKAELQPPTSAITTVADLTGGMGIDTLAFARVAEHVDYVERSPDLCNLMAHNLRALGLTNVSIHCADSMEWLQQQDRRFDLLFVDPARRDKQGRKVAAFEDCAPDILAHQELLLSKGKEIMVKASPMIDITLGASQLAGVSDIHVIAVQGECKEVLFRCGRADGEPLIHCDHLHHGGVDEFAFSREDEARAQATYASEMKKYLYEPNAALMKAGPFKLISQREGLEKLAQHTHLYTGDRLLQHFPGRIFSVLAEVSPSRKAVAEAIPDGKAHVVTRNYPVPAADLQKQLGLREGGHLFVVATTLGSRRTAFLCELIPFTP